MGKSAAKYRLCRCRCRCKINNLIREKTSTSVLFILDGPPALLTPFSPLGLLSSGSYPALSTARSFSPILLGSDLGFPEIAGCFGTFPASEIASNAHCGAWSWHPKFSMIFSLMVLAGRNAATGQSGLESTLLVNGRERRRMPTRSQPSERANFAKEHGRGWQGIWHRGRVIWS